MVQEYMTKQDLYKFAIARGYRLPKLRKMTVEAGFGSVALRSERYEVFPLGPKGVAIRFWSKDERGKLYERTYDIYDRTSREAVYSRMNGRRVR